MPNYNVHIDETYALEDPAQALAAVKEAVTAIFPPRAVTVTAPHDASSVTPTEAPSLTTLTDAKEIALAFLTALEARDIEAAEAFLGTGFTMTFPGTAPMVAVPELMDWARDRYRFVTKTITATDAFYSDGSAVVYVMGTLSGAWPEGTAFDGIRFIDRFAITSNKLISQDVWNDLAEERAR